MKTSYTNRLLLIGFVVSAVSMIIGFFLGKAPAQSAHGAVDLDRNGDSIVDATYIYSNTSPIKVQIDRNFDQTFDYLELLTNGITHRAMADDDYNGKQDSWTYFGSGEPFLHLQDLDGNGVEDVVDYFTNSLIQSSVYRVNATGGVFRISSYRFGRLAEDIFYGSHSNILRVIEYDVYGKITNDFLPEVITGSKLQLNR